MTEPIADPDPDSSPGRPASVSLAVWGAVVSAAMTGGLLVSGDRPPGYLGVGAALSALAAVVLAWPVRAGRPWARLGMMFTALVGALGAPAAANAHASSPVAFLLFMAIVGIWVTVVTLLLRVDSRAYFGALPFGGS
ncbi:CHASE2 domain-containing sensor protein [Actinokineospora baliensis]|uniref:hypothetical protein n=1 Tax=Actinokineospora baliensis TaxID=547056 RepID=UPI001958FB26|nr:hypothetical protein [Actinokineospora baliensis]MBM7770470.1 CHASE2 domain-containing sensor protein [Actinokineospora baliensis]